MQELRSRKIIRRVEEVPKKVEEKETSKPEVVKAPVILQQKKIAKDEPTISQRPTRKTKEAAAIYMEILGHKLVSEGKNDDDDNGSIDSFPELPNVRRMEQRENELKAKAKVVDKKNAILKAEPLPEKSKSKECDENIKHTRNNKTELVTSSTTIQENTSPIVKADSEKIITRNKSNFLHSESKSNKVKMCMVNEGKRTKSRNRRIELEAIKTSMIKAFTTSSDSDSTDEESKTISKLNVKDDPLKNVEVNVLQAKEEHCEKIDVIPKTDMITSIEKPLKKKENCFNDSDEEPLSKFTQAKSNSSIKSNVSTPKKMNIDINKKPTKELKVSSQTSIKADKLEKALVLNSNAKPKRECTKRSQSYLFSSSDDDEKYFHGFVEPPLHTKAVKAEPVCAVPVVASADLLRKDVGRRFGKGKVNMSNEQIEKWLKDSAMAGKMKPEDDDDMLKYSGRIPTETSFDLNLVCTIDTESLKNSLLTKRNVEHHNGKREIKTEIKHKLESRSSSLSNSSPLKQTPEKSTMLPRPHSNDRKPIFRKEKQVVRNVNAFSASNESSVYAFGEDEDLISTPFRRPMRRPSSTATSKSEDDSSKHDDSNKFRIPPVVKADTIKVATKQEVSLLLSTDDNSSTSIAVQVNLESSEPVAENINIESGTQTETGQNEQLFYIPLQPVKPTSSQVIQGVAVKLGTELTSGSNQRVVMRAKLVTQEASKMCPPAQAVQKHKSGDKAMTKPSTTSKTPDTSDEFKYKVPSSPSASSSSSAKICSRRQSAKPKMRSYEVLTPVNLTEFPSIEGPAQIVEAPTFHPNDKEFQDPMEYIEKIRKTAEQFGICRIVPPSNFKPECKVSDDMRFTAYNQYVHKMLHRWGPNFKELMAIKKYLETQNITLTHAPWVSNCHLNYIFKLKAFRSLYFWYSK